MRHRVYGNKLGRNKDQRSALFKGLVRQLFLHGTIHTSEVKAKAIKGLVDKVINLAKNKRTQLQIQSIITDKDLRDRLIQEIVPKVGNRNSGYTSLTKLGTRLGDQTMMVRMSIIGAEKLESIKKGIESRVKGTAKRVEENKLESAKTVKETKKREKKKG